MREFFSQTSLAVPTKEMDEIGKGVRAAQAVADGARPEPGDRRRAVLRWGTRPSSARQSDATPPAAAFDMLIGATARHGKPTHASPSEARTVPASPSLRRVVVQTDRARAAALDGVVEDPRTLWRGIVDRACSLVDRFESDGRRYLVARVCTPGVHDPRRLSARERQVLLLIALGRSQKFAAYELGIRISTATTHVRNAMRKLGVQRRMDLVRVIDELFAVGSRARSAESCLLANGNTDDFDPLRAFRLRYRGDDLAVLSIPCVAPNIPADVTRAERDVCHLILEGRSNEEIAVARGRSARTVANQVASIFRKLGVGSRLELAVRVAPRR
jgi:DNA-binding NarL/FixJ family response regulator